MTAEETTLGREDMINDTCILAIVTAMKSSHNERECEWQQVFVCMTAGCSSCWFMRVRCFIALRAIHPLIQRTIADEVTK